MSKGTVKWFNRAKGYGFIEPDDGSKDAFVHITAVQSVGLETLFQGQIVEYEMATANEGREMVENLKILVDVDQSEFTPTGGAGG
jgi:cold shock protein